MEISFKKGYSAQLDGLRGVAILLVLMYHYFWFTPIKKYSISGWMGVDLFFVLSGFLITGILYDSKHKKNNYANFIARRALRIFPLYYLVLSVCFFLVWAGWLPELRYDYQNQVYFWTYTENFLFVFKGWPPTHNAISGMLNHFWSLAIEEQFYLFWPFLILFARKTTILWVSCMLIALAIVLRNIFSFNSFYYIFTLARVDALLVGAASAILIRENVNFLRRIAMPLILCCSLVVLAIAFQTKDLSLTNIYFIRGGYTVIDVFFGCIVVLIYSTGVAGNVLAFVLKSRILIFFGKYSYAMYVYHFILYNLLDDKIAGYFTFSFTANYFISGSILLVLTVIIALLSYHLFEKHFLRLKKKFTV